MAVSKQVITVSETRAAANFVLKESQTGVITLRDDPEFADAIDCMVSYFYKAGYDISQYDTAKSLLHAQVATIADKYDCVSLYKLARTLFADTIKAVGSNDWFAVAAFIYNHTTTEFPAHEELRGLVVAAVADRPVVLKAILQLESTAELLRSNADLATDLLLSRPHMSKISDATEYIFTCGKCRYAHVGSRNCAYVADRAGSPNGLNCPECRCPTGSTTKRHTYKVGLLRLFPCPSCDGFHTANTMPEPEPERQTWTEDASD